MTTTEIDEREKQKHGDHDGHKQDMLHLSEQIERHYTSPSPAATIHTPAFFPASLDRGLLGGLLLGALLGVLFGWLVHSGSISPRGWEGLFSLGPFTFYAFWAFTGTALGLLIGGAISLLLTPAPMLQEMEGDDDTFVAEEGMQVVMVEVEE